MALSKVRKVQRIYLPLRGFAGGEAKKGAPVPPQTIGGIVMLTRIVCPECWETNKEARKIEDHSYILIVSSIGEAIKNCQCALCSKHIGTGTMCYVLVAGHTAENIYGFIQQIIR